MSKSNIVQSGNISSQSTIIPKNSLSSQNTTISRTNISSQNIATSRANITSQNMTTSKANIPSQNTTIPGVNTSSQNISSQSMIIPKSNISTPEGIISPRQANFNPSKRVKDIDWNDRKYIRAGIIPVIEHKGIKFFGFGVENGVAAIGDFGGHREKIDRDALDAAIREYREEALNVFGELTRDMLQDYFVLEGTDTVEILLPITGSLYYYTERFNKMVGDNTEHEVQSIIWLSRRQLLTAIDSQEAAFEGTKIYHMYNRIRDTIHLNRDVI
jgi:hypothetical protein